MGSPLPALRSPASPAVRAAAPRGRLAVTPTGIERPFTREQIIVSKTDPKGIIRYVNDTFLGVSGFSEAEVLGKPHSIVRHPDMPRAVFGRMWETIASGAEIFAFVVNLAVDGGHYWVLAHVSPTVGPDGAIVGYHSNRRWVDPSVRGEVAQVYARVRAAEQRQTSARAALDAGYEALDAELAAAGRSLETWVWSLSSGVHA